MGVNAFGGSSPSFTSQWVFTSNTYTNICSDALSLVLTANTSNHRDVDDSVVLLYSTIVHASWETHNAPPPPPPPLIKQEYYHAGGDHPRRITGNSNRSVLRHRRGHCHPTSLQASMRLVLPLASFWVASAVDRGGVPCFPVPLCRRTKMGIFEFELLLTGCRRHDDRPSREWLTQHYRFKFHDDDDSCCRACFLFSTKLGVFFSRRAFDDTNAVLLLCFVCASTACGIFLFG